MDQFLQDCNFSDLPTRSKFSTARRFVGQAIDFYRQFVKLLLPSELASSTFARGLSSFDNAVVKDGSEAHYTDSIQLLASYFVHRKGIAPHVKPVIVSEYRSLNFKFTADKVANAKEWVSFFSCYYELPNRLELFRFFRICCETLRSPCNRPSSLIVAVPGLKSDVQEFSLVFGACSVLLLQFRRSRVFCCPLLCFLWLMTYLVTGRGFYSSGSFQFGIYSPREGCYSFGI